MNALLRTLFFSKSARTLTQFIFAMNVWNNYAFEVLMVCET